jgi:hypothetical protein
LEAVAMASTAIERAPAMTVERVDAMLTLLAYELDEMTYVADRERAFLEVDHLLDVRNLIVGAGA